jgi:hypothetical protein
MWTREDEDRFNRTGRRALIGLAKIALAVGLWAAYHWFV